MIVSGHIHRYVGSTQQREERCGRPRTFQQIQSEWMINMINGELQKVEHQQRLPTATVHPYADEGSLLELARGGNKAAYAELYGRHAQKVYRVVVRMTRNHEDAEDVVQEAVMKAFVHLSGFEGRSAFSSWLTRIAINGVLMMRRKRTSDRESPLDGIDGSEAIQIADRAPDAETQILRRETAYRVQRAVAQLPSVLRVPMQHQLAEDLPVKDVANRLGISVPATKSRLLRARILVGHSVTQVRRRSAP